MISRTSQSAVKVFPSPITSPRRPRFIIPVFLVFLMLSSLVPLLTPPQQSDQYHGQSLELAEEIESLRAGEDTLYDYDLYVAAENQTAGGDGFITTERPDDGDQEDSSAIEGIEFRSAEMVSDLQIYGKGSTESPEIRMYYYLQFTGQEGSTADVTISLEAGGFQIADKTFSIDDPCNSGLFQSSCAYNGREIYFDDIYNDGFSIPSGKQLVIRIDAEATCESGDGGPIGGGSCDVRVAYGNVDNSGSSGFTKIEVRANAMANSEVRIHKLGGAWNDAQVTDWYPNHAPEHRTMQFSIDVRNSFGRYDINQVKLQLISPGETSFPFEKVFSNNELKLDNQGLVGNYNWTYNAGIAPGEYGIKLEITDLQGHSVIFEHDGIEMLEVGVSVELGTDQSDNLLVAPGKTSSVEFLLVHIGSSGIAVEVDFALQQSLGTGWLADFDKPAGYLLSGGGSFARPILSVTAPEDDMTNTPDTITIITRAYSDQDGDGTLEEVQVVTTTIGVEEVGVFASPRINVYADVEHQKEIADSARPEAYDETLSHFVAADQTGRFWLDILNSGFDEDRFRIKVKDIPEQWDVAIYDNMTSAELEKQQAAWLTPIIQSHSVDNFFIEVYPPPERDGVDSGILEIEVLSSGDVELVSTIQFTLHRTFGVYAEVIYDPYGLPDGHIGPFSAGAEIDMTIRISAQSGNSSVVTPWQIRNPASLDKNLEAENGMYGRWDWTITFASNGTFAPKVDLAANTSEEINLNIITKSGLAAGNHTIYLRIIEEGGNDEARYFDLPLKFEIGRDQPDDIQVTQKSELTPFSAGETREMSFKVYNGNNIDLTMLVSVNSPEGWEVSIKDNPLLSVPAFSEGNFTVSVNAPDSVRHGDDFTYTLEIRPVDSEIHFGEDFTVRKNVNVEVESVGIDRLMAELSNPRMPTIIAFVAIIFLLGIGFSRRRGGVVYEEFEDEEFDEVLPEDSDKETIDIPVPVIDDDLELIDDDLADIDDQSDIELDIEDI
jgi:uncharacterized membrane protein